ncbi:MAG: hypothetical protein NZM35_11650 [Chitinophagales bacterium]|nr:hypothetical protein [Chitinophagales bacterium]
MQKEDLAQSLLMLSDALEALAKSLQQQKQADAEGRVKEFSLLVKKFTKAVQPHAATADAALRAEVRKKHHKNFLIGYLQQRYIIAHSSINHLHVDEYLRQCARFLTQHYTHLRYFYRQLKSSISANRNLVFNPRGSSLQYIQKWCTMLQQHKLIDGFVQLRQGEIAVDISEIHQARLFILGTWLEVLLRSEVARWMRQHIHRLQNFDILSQVQIIKPDGKKSELDLLLMLNGKVYWFECKSNMPAGYYTRFAEHRAVMQLPAEQSFLLIPEQNDQVAVEVISRCGMSVLTANNLAAQLQSLFG